MERNNIVSRRYFRRRGFVFDCQQRMAVSELERQGVSCFTGADYEHVLSLYSAPGAEQPRFSRLFDLVCVGNAENSAAVDNFLSANAHNYQEVTGPGRAAIERLVSRILDAARRPADQTTGPTGDDAPRLSARTDDTLRPYQTAMKDRILDAWQRTPRIMLQMPTGTGKTRLFVSLISDIRQTDPSARVLIVTHRRELAAQTGATLSAHYRLPHAIPGRSRTAASEGECPILIASIQKLSRMQTLPPAGYIIIDEGHHSLAPSYTKLLYRYPAARVLGVTATPCRLRPASFQSLYGALLLSPSVRSFINDGYLADYRLFTVSARSAALQRVNRLTRFSSNGDYRTGDLLSIVDADEDTALLYEYYRTFAAGRQGIVYAVSRDHAAHIAAQFRAHGVNAAALDCDTPAAERRRIVDDFRSGRGVQVMVNVELFTEGFDCPAIGFVMLARPTRSLAMYLQQVGRALRPSPDASPVIILDAAGLYNRFGLPERPRRWQQHFAGLTPQGENYTGRPLGSSGVSGLMMEVTATRNTSGNVAHRPEESVTAAPAFTHITKYVSGVVKLTDRRSGRITIVCRGEHYEMSPDCIANTRHFYTPDRRLHVYSDGTVFRRISDHPVLYQATRGLGVTLCDASFRPLCHGDHLETTPRSCTVYKGGRPLQTLSFADYLCNGH